MGTVNNRLIAIDIWRFLFALLIVWHHIPWVDGAFHTMGWCPVSFFLIISGYLSVNSNTTNIKKFYVRKFFRIFPIYWICLIGSLILTIPIRSFWTIENISGIVKNIFMLQTYMPNESVDMYMNAPAWFLSVLVLFYFLLPLLQKLQRYSPDKFAVGVLMYFIAMVFITWWGFDGKYAVRINSPIMRLSECMLGMVMADKLRQVNMSRIHAYISIVVLLLFLYLGKSLPMQYIRPYLAIPIMMYLCASFVNLNINRCKIVDYVLLGGGKIGMEIYMFHNLIIIGLVRFADIFKVDFPIWLKISIVYVLTIAIAYAYNKVVNPLIDKMQHKVLMSLK